MFLTVLESRRHQCPVAEPPNGRRRSGKEHVKKLVGGSRANTYTLVSYNAAPIENRKLLWAAPVVWVKRA